MDSERITHVVRVIVKDNDLQSLVQSRLPCYQQVAQMVKVTTAKEGNPWMLEKHVVERVIQFIKRGPRAAKANFFLPAMQVDAGLVREGFDRLVEVKDERFHASGCLIRTSFGTGAMPIAKKHFECARRGG